MYPARHPLFLPLLIFSCLFIFIVYRSLVASSKVLIQPLSFVTPTIVSPSPTPSPTPQPTATIGLMGDLGLGRMITRIARQKNDYSWSFSGVASWLDQNDFNLANLESPITTNCPTMPVDTFTFCGDIRFLPQLQQHRFILNLANNHIRNFGQSGLDQTQEYLSSSQIPFFYTNFLSWQANDIKFGFLGFDLTGTHQVDTDNIAKQVSFYHPQVDWLIVSLHWGNEYLPQPESWRVKLARQLVDSGADIIHGHHPHVWQPPETYQNKLIFYSFGNFIFDQNWSQATSRSNIVRLTVTSDQVISQQAFPIEIKHNSRPIIVSSPSPTPLHSLLP